MTRSTKIIALAGLAAVALLALSACGGSSSTAGVASADEVETLESGRDAGAQPGAGEGAQAAAPTDGDQSGPAADEAEPAPDTFEDALLQFTRCLREQGLDVDDPDLSGGGRPGGILRDLQRNDPEVQAAFQACRSLLEGQRREFTPEQQAERQDQLIEFAKCLRSQGLEVDDPDFSGSGPGAGGRGIFGPNSLDQDDPEVAAALEACQDELPGRFGGGPRGAAQR